MYGWGASPAERISALPADDLVDPGVPYTTRALTIDAPAEQVWPWLVQIGEGRGGFYSFDVLERAVGADIRNVDTVHGEWQDLRVGDTIWLARRYGERASQVVADLAPNTRLVLVSRDDYTRLQRGEQARGAWAFHLQRRGERTRLIVRGSGGAVGDTAFDVAHFIMERKMMSGIRHRAERVWAESSRDKVCHLLESLPATKATP